MYFKWEALTNPKPKTQDPTTAKTLLRIVRLTVSLLLIGFLHVAAGTKAQRLSISVRNSPLDKLFSEIEKKTNYVFFYDVNLLQHSKPVTVEMHDASVEEILRISLKGQGIGFAIQDRTIFLKRDATQTINTGAELQLPLADGGGVTVEVRSEEGQPLGGATVFIRKLKITNITNSQGILNLKNIPDGEYEVEVSYVGFESFKTTLRKADGQTTVRASMKAAKNSMDEAQVIAYGTTSKILNTGDVTTVKGEDIAKQPVSDPMLALEGRVPGLYISQQSGIPGAFFSVYLQGRNSIVNGISPLYIVDGVPFTANSMTLPGIGGGPVGYPSTSPSPAQGAGLSPFNSLDPADIESITVLKDADATAIYGSRGANGVILITTKKGKAGQKNRIDLNVFSGTGKVTRMYHLLNTQQYLAMRHEAFYNDSIANPAAHIKPGASDYDINGTWDTTRYTDWQKTLIGGTAHFTNAMASLSGGDLNTQFVLGGGYSRQTTVYPGDFYDAKASVHANINHVSTNQRFRALFSAQYVNDINFLPGGDFTSAINYAPDAPAMFTSSGAINFANGTWSNPAVLIIRTAKATTNNLIGSLSLGYEILPGLNIRSSFGYTHIELTQTNQAPASATFGPANPNNRTNLFGTNNLNTWIIEPQLEYTRKVAQGKLDLLVGSTMQENTQIYQGFLAYGYVNDALISNVGSATTILSDGTNSSDYRYNALFGRLNYTWMDKYVVNATARRDGSSRFGPGKQFGDFGAVGAAWIFSKEKFIQNALPFLSLGKIRGSYGTTGNDQIQDYQYLSTYTTTTNAYQGITGLYPTQIANPYFAWEVVRKLEGGIELGWLKDRIVFGAAWYRNRTGNQLIGFPIPSQDGFTTIQANLPATVQNSGVELQLSTINFRTRNFTWSSSINATISENKLVSYPGLATSPYKATYALGKSLFIKSYYHNTGVDPLTGNYIFQDMNHDGSITSLDKYLTKPITQNYFGGFLNSFNYKGLQLDVFLQFVKQMGLNYLPNFGTAGYFNNNMPTYVLSRWHGSGQFTDIQRFTQTSGAASTAQSQMTSSDLIITDASFIRLKNLSLSYTLPVKWLHKAALQSARLYIQCQNLFTITSYRGLDPETQGKSLPPLKIITGGLQISL